MVVMQLALPAYAWLSVLHLPANCLQLMNVNKASAIAASSSNFTLED